MPVSQPPLPPRPGSAGSSTRPLPARLPSPLRDRFGVCQWFHFEDESTLERSLHWLRELGVRHLRTGISWADYHRPGGPRWYEHLMSRLTDFEVLLSVWHTPPSIAESGDCASPPRRLRDYADFIDQVITAHGDHFSHLELWNEPNNRYKWNFLRDDPDWRKFGAMIEAAARWAATRGVPTVLGGMIPVDPAWLRLMAGHGALADIDVVAIHGFPGMWWPKEPCWDWASHWSGWPDKIAGIQPAAGDRPIWVTETGLATWDPPQRCPGRHAEQCHRLLEAMTAPAERVYWYSLLDLNPAYDAIEGFHVDENEYHLGLVTHDDRPKPAFHVLQDALLGRRAPRAK